MIALRPSADIIIPRPASWSSTSYQQLVPFFIDVADELSFFIADGNAQRYCGIKEARDINDASLLLMGKFCLSAVIKEG